MGFAYFLLTYKIIGLIIGKYFFMIHFVVILVQTWTNLFPCVPPCRSVLAWGPNPLSAGLVKKKSLFLKQMLHYITPGELKVE